MCLTIGSVCNGNGSRDAICLCFGLGFLRGIGTGFCLVCLRIWFPVVGWQGEFADPAGVGEELRVGDRVRGGWEIG